MNPVQSPRSSASGLHDPLIAGSPRSRHAAASSEYTALEVEPDHVASNGAHVSAQSVYARLRGAAHAVWAKMPSRPAMPSTWAMLKAGGVAALLATAGREAAVVNSRLGTLERYAFPPVKPRSRVEHCADIAGDDGAQQAAYYTAQRNWAEARGECTEAGAEYGARLAAAYAAMAKDEYTSRELECETTGASAHGLVRPDYVAGEADVKKWREFTKGGPLNETELADMHRDRGNSLAIRLANIARETATVRKHLAAPNATIDEVRDRAAADERESNATLAFYDQPYPKSPCPEEENFAALG